MYWLEENSSFMFTNQQKFHQPAKLVVVTGHHIFGYKKGVLENFDDNFMPQKNVRIIKMVKMVSYSRNRLKWSFNE